MGARQSVAQPPRRPASTSTNGWTGVQDDPLAARGGLDLSSTSSTTTAGNNHQNSSNSEGMGSGPRASRSLSVPIPPSSLAQLTLAAGLGGHGDSSGDSSDGGGGGGGGRVMIPYQHDGSHHHHQQFASSSSTAPGPSNGGAGGGAGGLSPAALASLFHPNNNVRMSVGGGGGPTTLEQLIAQNRQLSRSPLGGGGGQGSSSAGSGSRHHHHRIPPIHAFRFFDIKCPMCNKMVPSDEAECHLVMCLTRPRITYNEDVLTEDKGECVICFDEMHKGDTIARLPCLCVYHKGCIDSWFEVRNTCPEHPGEE